MKKIIKKQNHLPLLHGGAFGRNLASKKLKHFSEINRKQHTAKQKQKRKWSKSVKKTKLQNTN
jgi:hypothetical protein